MECRKILIFTLILTILLPNQVFANSPWEQALDLSNINYAHNRGITAKGVTIAVIDTSFVDLPQLRLAKIIEFDNKKQSGHGTYTTSVLRQIAPDVEVYALAHGGKTSGVIKALQWCVDNDVDIVNMSIGYRTQASTNILNPKIKELDRKGTIMVASAGNSDFDEYYPAYIDGVYSVGGVSLSSGQLVKNHHNNANWIDFVFLSTQIPALSENGNIVYLSGTSLSTPGVAGMFALAKQEYPRATKDELYNLLTQDGIKINGVNGVYPVYPTKTNPPKPVNPPENNFVNEFLKNIVENTNKRKAIDAEILELNKKLQKLEKEYEQLYQDYLSNFR